MSYLSFLASTHPLKPTDRSHHLKVVTEINVCLMLYTFGVNCDAGAVLMCKVLIMFHRTDEFILLISCVFAVGLANLFVSCLL